MLACGQAKLLDPFRTHQVVGTPVVDDDMCTSVVDDEEDVKQVVALLLGRLLHLCAKNTLDDDAPFGGCHQRTKSLAFLVVLVGVVLAVIFYIRSAHIASICRRYV
jgi:hypothetical protein